MQFIRIKAFVTHLSFEIDNIINVNRQLQINLLSNDCTLRREFTIIDTLSNIFNNQNKLDMLLVVSFQCVSTE